MSHVTYDELTTFTFSDGAAATPDPTPSVVDPSTFGDRVIVDVTNGSDTLGAGVEHAPYKTIAHAIDSTTGNVIVILNHGDYPERVSVPRDRAVWIFGRGLSRIDCQDVRSAVTVQSGNTTSGGGILILENVHFINPAPNGFFIQPKNGIGSSGAGISDGAVICVNCVGYSDEVTSTVQVAYFRNANGYILKFFGCTFKNVIRLVDDGTDTSGGGNTDCAVLVYNTIIESTDTTRPICRTTGRISDGSVSNTLSAWTAMVVSGCAFTDTVTPGDLPNRINLLETPAPYVNATFGGSLDLSLDPSGSGYDQYNFDIGDSHGLIGATYYPRLGFNVGSGVGAYGEGATQDSSWKDHQSFGSWISDSEYEDEDPEHKPMLRQDSDTLNVGDAFFVGDGWYIDGVGTGALKSPWMRVPVINGQADVMIVQLQYEADLEDTDSVAMQYRFAPASAYSGGVDDPNPPSIDVASVTIPWISGDKGELSGGVAFEQEYVYVQVRLILTVGEV